MVCIEIKTIDLNLLVCLLKYKLSKFLCIEPKMKGELLGYLEMEKIQTKITLGFYFVLFRIWPIFNLACKDIFF